MKHISVAAQLIIFSRYIGQQVMIISLLNNSEVNIGALTGVKHNAIAVNIDDVIRWIPLYDNFKLCEIKILLKPLKKLTPDVVSAANKLPVKAFITPYYQQLGYDMPVFIEPGHPCNCKYVQELELADYRTPAEIYRQNALLHAFESA
ncbi:hypothetical protein J3L18_14105 [Mucilaginibacter gossypii]|uniref:hypothetical protein n=1 Tax=Mucilaginibacter gossypii TaxID=551996 RepID=UPI000DCCEAAD|nr:MULTISPECIES: hypothetical protein [Mucilaginibacter]QTE40134.1 hypothetical protein J3L18_14105 [Mucilaginibacter gossypii]RAV50069.1 hypothetical protein DIU36_26640 [Mucilaginibacter rubeus]